MTGFTVIGEEQPFWHAQGKSIGWDFAGPGGLDCTVDLFGAATAGRAYCTGLRPDVAPGTWEVMITESMAGGGLSLRYPEETPSHTLPPRLPPRHLIRDAESGLVCGADADLLACRVGDHGFLVTATTTTLF